MKAGVLLACARYLNWIPVVNFPIRTISAVVLILLTTVSVASNELNPPADAGTLLEKAQELAFEYEDCEGAIQIYEMICRLHADTAEANEANLGLAMCLSRLNKLSEAQQLLERILENVSGDDASRALLLLSTVNRQQGDLAAARRALVRIIAGSPPGNRWRNLAEPLLVEIEEELAGAPGILEQTVRESLHVSAVIYGQRMCGLLLAIIVLVIISRIIKKPNENCHLLRRTWRVSDAVVLFSSIWLVVAVWNVFTDWIVLRMMENETVLPMTALTLLEYRAAPVLIVTIIVVLKGEGLAVFRRPRGRELLSAIVLILTCVVLLVVVWLLWSHYATSGSDDQDKGFTISYGLTVVGIVYLLVITISEECMYRGVLYQAFRNKVGVIGAVFLSASLFSFAHLYDPINTGYAFLFGLLAALLMERFRTLLIPVCFHWLMSLVIQIW